MALSTEVIMAMWLPMVLSIGYMLYRQRTHNGVAAAVQLLVCIVIAALFAVMAVLLYQSRTRPHVAFEFPLEVTGSGESECEFWMALPPGSYVTSLLFFPEPPRPDSVEGWAKIDVEYSLLIDGEVVDEFSGSKDFSLRGPRFTWLGVGIPVGNSGQEVHVKLHTKCALSEEKIPHMRFSIQTNDEMRLKKEGYSINRKTFDPSIAY